MRTRPRLALAGVAAIAAMLVAAGCGNDAPSGMDHGTNNPGSTDASSETVNQTDVMFAQNMIIHHQQAVEMADLAATRAEDTQLKDLAADIKTAQAPEIEVMAAWLTAWGHPTMPPGGHGMPGMMSEDDMKELMVSAGAAFDRKFAEMMIEHHNGAIEMAREEKAKGADQAAKQLAATIEETQTREVATLQQILARL
jgi:uncharacterized protein (DUF305 family)